MATPSKNQVYALAKDVISFLSDKEFLAKIKLTFLMLIIYRSISFIPLPGINLQILTDEFLSEKFSGSFLNFLNRFSGGALNRMSIMALGISPYITCSLFFSFAHLFSTYFAELKKEGALGRQKVNDYTKLAALSLGFFQGMAFAVYCELLPNSGFVMFPGLFFQIQTGLLLASATMIVIWISDQISIRGLGSGSSIVIYASIVSGVHNFLGFLYQMFKQGKVSSMKLFLFFIVAFLLLIFVTFCERVYKTIKAQNLSHGRNAIFKNMPDHLVYMKLNPAGIYPSMFASTLMATPAMLDNLLHFSNYEWGAWILASLTAGCYLYIFFHAVLIFGTSYLYSEIVFNPEETAKRFRNDSIISGQMPGKSTQSFLEEKLFYVATLGGIYLMLVCCLPEFFITKENQSFFISGTSYIIVVGVATDLIDKVSAGVYSLLLKKSMKVIRKGYF